ncbi:MAG TPA: transposase [Candidatus Paceibacterota bacterium]|jgi:REP element-mobilizing transposase RayT|nr:transposase [Candidatus Paceibacterota bacterium]
MAIRTISFVEQEYYHIYNRGNSKQVIFHDNEDYQRFREILFILNSTRRFNIYDIKKQRISIENIDREKLLVAIGAFCLMPNHFHILITPLMENGASKFMHKISTSYSKYYNQKYKRTGSLFEGKFKAEHITNERYLKYIFSYIHLNPISLTEPRWKEHGIQDKKKVLNFLYYYIFSSYKDFSNPEHILIPVLNKEYFPNYFPTKQFFKKEIFSWIQYREARRHDTESAFKIKKTGPL